MARETIIPRGAKVRRINLSRKVAACPTCGAVSRRHSLGHRKLREAGIARPIILDVVYSKHFCRNCERHFNIAMDHIAVPSGIFTNRVRKLALHLVNERNLTLEAAAERMREKYHVAVPPTTLHDWVVEAR